MLSLLSYSYTILSPALPGDEDSGHVPETASRRARTRFIRTPLEVAISLAVAALGLYMMFSHTGHVLTALPYLFLAVYPLMHFFRHAGPHKP